MKLLLIGLGLVAASIFYVQGRREDEVFLILFFSGIGLSVIGLLRFIWFKAETISRSAGGFAAKVANHADTFKGAFKDARNK